MDHCSLELRERVATGLDTCRTSSVNPMDNHLIIKGIFEACDVNTLRSCRLVCKEWRDESLDSWRRQAVLGVTEEDTLVTDSSKAILLQDLIERLEGSKQDNEENRGVAGWKLLEKPFRNYRLFGIAFLDNGPQHGFRLLEEFIGESTTYLSFLGCAFSDSIQRVRLFSLVPNLRELKLSNFHDTQLVRGRVPETPELPVEDGVPLASQGLRKLKRLELILENGIVEFNLIRNLSRKGILLQLSNLEALSITFYQPRDSREGPDNSDLLNKYLQFTKLLEVIGQTGGVDGKRMQLTELDMLNLYWKGIETLPSSVISQLNGLQLKLKKLKVDVGSNTRESEVSKLLETHASTLEDLTLFQLVGSGSVLKFPFGLQMGSLHILHLHGNLMDDLGFLKWTPKLKSLHIFYDSRKFYEDKYSRNSTTPEGIWKTPRMKQDVVAKTLAKFSMEGVCLEKLEDLQGDFKVSTKKTFKKLTEWMPNVRTLYLPVSTLTFPVACEGWSHSLRIWKIPKWCNLNDEAITGIRQSFDGIPKGRSDRFPNITDIIGLTSFSVESARMKSIKPTNCEHTMTSFSDYSIVNGFLHLPHLSSLRIYTPRPVKKVNLKALEQKVEKLVICDSIDRCPCGRNVLVKNRPGFKVELLREPKGSNGVDEGKYVKTFEIEIEIRDVLKRGKLLRDNLYPSLGLLHIYKVHLRNVNNHLNNLLEEANGRIREMDVD